MISTCSFERPVITSSPVPGSREKWTVGSESAILCMDSDIRARSCLVFGSTAIDTIDSGNSKFGNCTGAFGSQTVSQVFRSSTLETQTMSPATAVVQVWWSLPNGLYIDPIRLDFPLLLLKKGCSAASVPQS